MIIFVAVDHIKKTLVKNEEFKRPGSLRVVMADSEQLKHFNFNESSVNVDPLRCEDASLLLGGGKRKEKSYFSTAVYEL